MRESAIEKHFREKVQAAGGRCYKWVSPGNPGVPDRIVIFNGMVHFVELKTERGPVSEQQKIQHRWLADLGFEVQILRSKEQADLWVELNASVAAKMNPVYTYQGIPWVPDPDVPKSEIHFTHRGKKLGVIKGITPPEGY